MIDAHVQKLIENLAKLRQGVAPQQLPKPQGSHDLLAEIMSKRRKLPR